MYASEDVCAFTHRLGAEQGGIRHLCEATVTPGGQPAPVLLSACIWALNDGCLRMGDFLWKTEEVEEKWDVFSRENRASRWNFFSESVVIIGTGCPESGGVTVPGGVKEREVQHWGTQCGSTIGGRWVVGLGGLRGVFQPSWCCNSLMAAGSACPPHRCGAPRRTSVWTVHKATRMLLGYKTLHNTSLL